MLSRGKFGLFSGGLALRFFCGLMPWISPAISKRLLIAGAVFNTSVRQYFSPVHGALLSDTL